jgi:hypothetical protein
MIEGIEPLYQKIAESIQEAIPEEWSTAKMDAVFYPDGITFVGEYQRKADGKARDFGTTRKGEHALRELRIKFKEAGKPLWGQVCFELHSDGTFSMKLGYDNCDDNGVTVFNEEGQTGSDRHFALYGLRSRAGDGNL